MVQHKHEDGEMHWLSPNEPPFQISGFAWWSQEHKYRRLPVVGAGAIREEVDELANHTAGGQIRFQTNATKLIIKVRLFGPNNMEHIPGTAVNGFDCYLGLPGEQLYYSTTRFPHNADEYESVLFTFVEPELRCITLNFPLYQGVHEVQIGVNTDAKMMEYPPYDIEGKVIVYGTSITQGGCASRPGMAYSNILSRRFNIEFINLGFSGNGKGDPEIAEFISQIEKPECLVLDYDANCVNLDGLITTMSEFIRIFRRRHSKVPILVVSRTPCGYEHAQSSAYEERVARRNYQSGLVRELRDQGDRFIYFCDGADLLGEVWNECTVDGLHPTDLGFMQIANGLTPILKDILTSLRDD
ncbi:SGNH/GDSL hydrolase family protein [Paenibacillus mendelii]|uniref:SGNH/GDSL hydrolase family protein n=1 Tax=Paenibacillus mendelii TaxID=206163 RepID=A0ABV6J571_9BACL|nr:SGNH/GDSL hydrolase family protein [Paenibacillus mendelii]MCQ6560270.1 SGNH/GDSL hydrolase family protein [Paenibacillus mendelii]